MVTLYSEMLCSAGVPSVQKPIVREECIFQESSSCALPGSSLNRVPTALFEDLSDREIVFRKISIHAVDGWEMGWEGLGKDERDRG